MRNRTEDPDEVDIASLPAGQRVELFGHVTLVQGYALPQYSGCRALVVLRDAPGQTVAVLASQPWLQSLLETALATGNLIAFRGEKLLDPPNPEGGGSNVEVFGIDVVTLYCSKQ